MPFASRPLVIVVSSGRVAERFSVSLAAGAVDVCAGTCAPAAAQARTESVHARSSLFFIILLWSCLGIQMLEAYAMLLKTGLEIGLFCPFLLDNVLRCALNEVLVRELAPDPVEQPGNAVDLLLQSCLLEVDIDNALERNKEL